MREEIELLEMNLELILKKLTSKFRERELMQQYYYDKQLDYEITKEILKWQKLYNYIDELKENIMATGGIE